MGTGRLVFVHDPNNWYGRLSGRYEIVDSCHDIGGGWLVARDTVDIPRASSRARPDLSLAEKE